MECVYCVVRRKGRELLSTRTERVSLLAFSALYFVVVGFVPLLTHTQVTLVSKTKALKAIIPPQPGDVT